MAQPCVLVPSVVKRYTERPKTAYEHKWEIRDAYEYHSGSLPSLDRLG